MDDVKFSKVKEKFYKNVVKNDGCWEWKGAKDYRGYGRIYVEPRKCIKAHRFSWILYNGEIPNGMVICHKCDNPQCCNPKHLFCGTQKDNMTDCFKKGRIDNYVHGSGEKNNSAKFTNEQVKKIRDEYSSGKSLAYLSKKYNVSNIVRIVRNKCYYDPEYTPINGNAKPREHSRKLNENQIEEILKSSCSSRKIAEKLGVSKTLVLYIRKNGGY